MKIIQKFYAEYNGKRFLAGMLGADMVFRKKVKRRHKLRKHTAFGLDKSYVDDVFTYPTQKIELTVSDDGQAYEIDVATFKKYAFLDDVGEFRNRYYCNLRYWQSRPISPNRRKQP